MFTFDLCLRLAPPTLTLAEFGTDSTPLRFHSPLRTPDHSSGIPHHSKPYPNGSTSTNIDESPGCSKTGFTGSIGLGCLRTSQLTISFHWRARS